MAGRSQAGPKKPADLLLSKHLFKVSSKHLWGFFFTFMCDCVAGIPEDGAGLLKLEYRRL